MSLESTPMAAAPKPAAMHSMFGGFGAPAAPAAPPSGADGLGSAFGSMRDSTVVAKGDDDDEDEEGVHLRQGGISLDQAKRITMQSAWRSLRA